ncbi:MULTISPECIES: branched-chain amino acid transport system II carrier protein [Mammaliicoccus]|uniref:Branched-chain amino acid transport system carrier protein n=1 Tax=Mammaliicoccus fleurettii TaxID=150056 RepID=A0ABS5MM09_9STAP|nr:MULTISPECIES: branched-chain amino acid transport system II carrier protein [Mammaliicoccus]HCN59776.1 branched-chain amino acid transport system II carrier protein [Staphylococcus sp.]MBL0846065.1 branched-chain amino acid transport system II carrier protein [Mammaliicoccus fleurettii]MBS3671333.1 branched-chain amino acid transport system II carrier protein [Mammaliicoccus fleurettii]MBS3696292.1 branched-chain amino acid transport system II carrier protein [Mammaliicoccus fleurettii]MEB6
MNKNIFVVGFMLFAIFFGAGNLIFPPALGLSSGNFFWPAIFGFVITGIGLPLIGVITGSIEEKGYRVSLGKIHPVFAVVLLVAISLTIGPLFAIPRTAATSFEMGITPIFETTSSMSLFIFTLIYFIIVFYLSFNSSKMVDKVGSILTPLLLISITALIVKAFITLSGESTVSGDPAVYSSSGTSFGKGFVEGYLTMDAIAAIAFSMIVITAIKSKGVTKETGLFKQTIFAGIIAAIALGFIYISLGWIGNHMNVSAETIKELNANGQNIGTYLLTSAANLAFGEFGKYLIGIIVALACLTTATGLIVSVSEFFNELLPKISYKWFVAIFTLISFILSNQGLTTVIKGSLPVLLVLYPIAITAVLLILLAKYVKTPPIAQQLAVAFVTIISFISVFNQMEWATIGFISKLPLAQYQMEWIPFAIVGFIIGFIIGKVKNQAPIEYS